MRGIKVYTLTMRRSGAEDMVVITADQRASRSGPDLVEALLANLASPTLTPHLVLPFERTAGDEVQGVVADAEVAARLAVHLTETGSWTTGLGVGPVRRPLPRSTRAASGPAFEHARTAVERAKTVPEAVAVDGADPEAARHAEAVLQLLVAVAQRRSAAGHEVVLLLREGLSQTAAATRLGITKQAVSQRARAAWWTHEEHALPAAAELLRQAAGQG